MTGAVFETVSELILFGFVPSLVTVATVWIIWLVLEKINPDEVADIRTFLTFIIAVVPFVMLICSGLGIVIHDEMMAASVGCGPCLWRHSRGRSLPARFSISA
jgi:hypothetical protein